VLSLALSVLGIGKRLLSWLSEAVRWLFKAWYRIAIAVLLMVGVYLFLANISLRKQVTHWKERYTTEATAHIKTKRDYAQAQADAELLNKAEVERIEGEYAAIAVKSEKDYAKRIADNRATVDRWLRAKAAAGVASGTGTSETAAMSSGVVQGTEEAIIPVSDLLIVADAYAQLDALRAWALEVGKVE